MKRIRERGKEGFDDTEDEEEPVEEEEATGEDDQTGEDEQAGEGRVNFAWSQDLESNDVFLVELLFECDSCDQGWVWPVLSCPRWWGLSCPVPTERCPHCCHSDGHPARRDGWTNIGNRLHHQQRSKQPGLLRRNILISPPFGKPLVTKYT